MGDSLAPPSLSNSTVPEVSNKIIIAAVIVVFVVATLVLLHLFPRRFWPRNEDPAIISWRRQLAGQHAATAAVRRRGLDRSTFKSLPVVAYNPKEFKNGLECAVCLCELQEGEKTRLLPKCNHGFHVDCIDTWFKSHSTCPICRDLVVSDSDSDTSSDSNIAVEVAADDESSNEGGNSVESRAFPTNVLFWGDETQVRSPKLCSEEGQRPSQAANSAASASGNANSSGRIGGRNGTLVIEIPVPCESCSPLSTPPSTRLVAEDGANSPVATRWRSLKRLFSRGKRVAPSPCSSSRLGSGDVEQV